MKAKYDGRLPWHNRKFEFITLVVVVFIFGIFVGRLDNRNRPQRLIRQSAGKHGSVIRLQDISLQSTSHVDNKTGKPIRKRQFLEPSQIPNLSGFQVANLEPGQRVDSHSHETMHEVFYILSGKGTFNINGVEHEALEGTMFHLAPLETHSIYVDEQSKDGDLVMAYFGVTTTS